MIVMTGASGGIGKRVVRNLLKLDGVMGIYNSSRPKSSRNKRLIYEKLNIENTGEIQSFVKKWKNKFGKVTLIHSAVSNVDGLMVNYPESSWDRVIGVNLKGNFLLTQALMPHMIQNRWGRIIHISSVKGVEGAPGTLAYSASKTGLIGMSRVLAKEYARFNITSNVLILGYFEAGLFNMLSDEGKKRIVKKIPSGRLGDFSNIANAVSFLMKSEYVNGAVINIDGGI